MAERIYYLRTYLLTYLQSHHETSAPSFCYALHAADVGTSCRLWSDATAHAFSPHIFRSLGSIVFDETSGRGRVSFAARLLYRLVRQSDSHFYVFFSVLSSQNGKLHMATVIAVF